MKPKTGKEKKCREDKHELCKDEDTGEWHFAFYIPQLKTKREKCQIKLKYVNIVIHIQVIEMVFVIFVNKEDNSNQEEKMICPTCKIILDEFKTGYECPLCGFEQKR